MPFGKIPAYLLYCQRYALLFLQVGFYFHKKILFPYYGYRIEIVSFLQVICKQCNHCRDIDLCKDPFVSTDRGGTQAPVWICASAECRTPYDTDEIEHLLLDAVQRKTMGYSLQDLTCLKCHQVKSTNMAKVKYGNFLVKNILLP